MITATAARSRFPGTAEPPRFYFTAHPSDLRRNRLLEGCHLMLVAAAHWDDERRRFKIARPPADHISSICIDSGGFTAAQRWGRYPWRPAEYADFIREMSRDVTLDFCAVMDYACEPGVNRATYRSNRERIKATIRNEVACKMTAPALPWLSVLQGDSLEERTFDLALRRRMDLLPDSYAGVGSVCGRHARGAVEAVCFYLDRLPGVEFHPFGMHIQALDHDAVYAVTRSWDSYSWNWGRGQTEMNRPDAYLKRSDETHSEHTHRLARLYWQNTIRPRLRRPRQTLLI